MKNKYSVLVYALLVASISVCCYTKPQTRFSNSERRLLAQKPVLTAKSFFSGEYSAEFEKYCVDQFPFRDKFRSIKAMFATYVLQKKDNNGFFIADGHISKLDYEINFNMLDYAAEKFRFIYNSYMKDKNVNVYLSIVPDKNCFIAENNGYLAMDYNLFVKTFTKKTGFMQYINIFPLLSKEDYYRTDSHWKQEEICDIAEFIALKMGTDVKTEYKITTLKRPFFGVYSGQAALIVNPDEIKYLSNEKLSKCTVSYYDGISIKQGDIYDMEKASGKDPYEMFLSGNCTLVEIENPKAKTKKELVIFRDSFGSSLIPLLAEGYRKITAVDIRYLESQYVGDFIAFNNQDVLFLYSSSLLNNSLAIR